MTLSIELDPLDAIVLARLVAGLVERLRQRLVEDVVDQRRLAGSADAGDRGQQAERNLDVDVLQVVLARAADDELALQRRPPRRRRRNRSRAGEIGAGQRAGSDRPLGSAARDALHQLLRRALEDHMAAEIARARPEVDDVVGDPDRLFVVLDDDDGVAEIAQARQRRRAASGCRAGAGRSTARRGRTARRSGSRRSASPAGCAALRRPTASPRCGRGSGSRRRRRSGSVRRS